MKRREIREELEMGVRCFLEAQDRSQQSALDEFDRLRILEASFNRLFLSVEHACNAIMLLETGNYSKKHFGDIARLQQLKEKYHANFSELYTSTYSFRSYADYRKHPEVEKDFTIEQLKKSIVEAKRMVITLLNVFGKEVAVSDLQERLTEGNKE